MNFLRGYPMVKTIERKPIRAYRGTKLHCKNWQIEAILRMLQNNLDPDVANDWQNLIVYGGSGQAARNWECFDKIAYLGKFGFVAKRHRCAVPN